MAGYQNLSYFIQTLPETYDTWNISFKLDYFVDNLQNFTQFDVTDQIAIVTQ